MSLLAAVVHVSAERDLPLWLGRAAQAWLLSAVRSADPDVADRLHRGQSRRPYTVSGPRGDTPWLRITSVDGDLSVVLLDRILPTLQQFTLADIALTVTSVETDGHSWAGHADFESLAHAAFDAATPTSPAFEFGTPTAFHHNGLAIPLPMPALVYGSLIQSWNHFSPVPLPVRLDDFLQSSVGISRHRIATRSVRFGENEQHIGFVGTTRYVILPEDKTAYSPDEYRLRVQTFDLLTRFAFYVGVGVRTTVGMGQVRPLDSSIQPD